MERRSLLSVGHPTLPSFEDGGGEAGEGWDGLRFWTTGLPWGSDAWDTEELIALSD